MVEESSVVTFDVTKRTAVGGILEWMEKEKRKARDRRGSEGRKTKSAGEQYCAFRVTRRAPQSR